MALESAPFRRCFERAGRVADVSRERSKFLGAHDRSLSGRLLVGENAAITEHCVGRATTSTLRWTSCAIICKNANDVADQLAKFRK